MRVKVGSDRFSGISMALGVGIPCIHIGSVNFNVRIAFDIDVPTESIDSSR